MACEVVEKNKLFFICVMFVALSREFDIKKNNNNKNKPMSLE